MEFTVAIKLFNKFIQLNNTYQTFKDVNSKSITFMYRQSLNINVKYKILTN